MKKIEIRLHSDYVVLKDKENCTVSVDETVKSIPEDILEKLKKEKVYIMYSNYEFVGCIWWDKKNQQLHMEPYRYAIRGHTASGKNLEELIHNYLMNP